MANDEEPKVWEARIKYYQSYIYDKQFLPGMIFEVKNGNLTPVTLPETEKTLDTNRIHLHRSHQRRTRIHPRMGKTPRIPSTKIPQSSHRHRSLLTHNHTSARPTRSHLPSNLLLTLHIGRPEKSPHAQTRKRRNPNRKRTSCHQA